MSVHDSEVFGHNAREDRKAAGATYTPRKLAAAVARNLAKDVAGDEPADTSRNLRILDPGCGDGALTIALLDALPAAVREKADLTCMDTDRASLDIARARIARAYPGARITVIEADFLAFAIAQRQASVRYDLIIANPPYVRVQTLHEKVRELIEAHFTLPGRTDLAFPFILGLSDLLAPNGRAAVITSNRILTTDAGRPVREVLMQTRRVTEVWDLGDTKLFEAAVLPAVLFFENCGSGETGADDAAFTSIYEAPAGTDEPHAPCLDICADLSSERTKKDSAGRIFQQRRGQLATDGAWRLSSPATSLWLARIKDRNWMRFGDIGSISVGIKSTADKVFIAETWPEPRPELLRPLITHHVAGRYRAAAPADREVLYPHEMRDGKRQPVALGRYPVSEAYLETHRARLEGRGYVLEAGRKWYEIWVPHSPQDWADRKIVFRDICVRPTFWVDHSGSVVNGDCYWIRLHPDVDPDLIWLMLAVGNSRLIEAFYDAEFNERLYAGRRRFMTRHVRQFPLPDPRHPAARLAAEAARRLCEEVLQASSRESLERQVDQHIEEAFGLR